MSPAAFHPIAGGPCETLAEAAVHARRPFTSGLVQARIWTPTETGADVVYYVDVRAVIDRLNVLLPGRWQAAYELVDQRAPGLDGDAALVYQCRLEVAGETYADVGEGPDHKAARSDALKRAAVHLGIGHCLYRIGRIAMKPGPRPHQLRARDGRLELDDHNRRWLRDRYKAWLLREGIAEYGLPLAHGRAARSVAPELFPADPRTVLKRRRAPAHAEPGTAPQPRPQLAALPSPPAPAPASQPPAPAAPASGPASRPATAAPASGPASPPATAAPPASPSQRAALTEIARGHGYSPATLAALVRCTHSATLDELGEAALQDVRNYVVSAVGGRVGDAELAARIAELAAPAPGEPPARERLADWLLTREALAAA